MRISDWSSDVCSSDLSRRRRQAREEERAKYETTTEDCDRARDDHSFLIRDLLDGADIFIVEHGLGDACDHVLLVGIAFNGLDDQIERADRSEEHTSELQSLMRISYAVFCLQKKNNNI